MSVKTLHEVVEESQNRQGEDLTPFPDEFARIMGDIEKTSAMCQNGRQTQATSFVTASGLRFVFSDNMTDILASVDAFVCRSAAGEEIVRIAQDGRIFWRQREVETDKQFRDTMMES